MASTVAPSAGLRLAAWAPLLAVAPTVVLLVVFFAWPVGGLLVNSLFDGGFNTAAYIRLVEAPVYRVALGNTLMIAGLVTALSIVMAYPLAYLMASTSRTMAQLLLFVVLLPFWTSALVRTTAWIVLLQRNGVVNDLLLGTGLVDQPVAFVYNLSGVLIGMTHVLMPFVVLPLYAAFRGFDRTLAQAAEGLGARPPSVFLRIVAPLTAPGVVAGGLIVFMNAIGYYITPALMGGPGQLMIAQLISYNIQENLDWAMAAALAIVLLATTLALFWVFQRFFGVDRLFGSSGLGSGGGGPIGGRHGGGRWALVVAGLAVGVFLIAPILVVFPMSLGKSPFLAFPPDEYSFRWFINFFETRKWLRALGNSLEVAVMAVTAATVLGTLAAIGLSRLGGRLRSVLESVVILPLIVPVIVLAVALYYAFAPLGLIGTTYGLALGHTLLALPFVVITVRAALKGFDPNLELAARGLGAAWPTIFRRIMLPAIWPGMAAGAVFAFIVSFDDVVVALFITNIRSRTLPKLMFEGIAHQIDPTIVAIAALLILVSLLVLLLNLVLTRSGRR